MLICFVSFVDVELSQSVACRVVVECVNVLVFCVYTKKGDVLVFGQNFYKVAGSSNEVAEKGTFELKSVLQCTGFEHTPMRWRGNALTTGL